ncbi:hypothetical protein MLD38_010199 [Melastoma candidum]|uniref:Uncharacterized protein n=1 Tax=Melastoma candidum TaxID=119954 RepID=A0ACB9R058_9MYRT|nr:hypothetical protein MLD38_010199 [Melastoma candidum]
MLTKTKKNSSSPPHVLLLPPDRRSRSRSATLSTAFVLFASLLLSSAAWLSLVFHPSHHSPPLPHHRLLRSDHLSRLPFHPSLHQPPGRVPPTPLALNHLLFGIAGSSHLWDRRKEIVRLWWRPLEMRGHVWLEEPPRSLQPPGAVDSSVNPTVGDDSGSLLPKIMVSDDTSRFRYTNPTGHPSGLRIARIIKESFHLGLDYVRWFVLGDDDTLFNVDNLVDVLAKYDWREMVYVGSPSESHSANTYFSYNMAFGGGGIAVSYGLAKVVVEILDDCLERYPKLYGSDDRLHACISEIGVPLSREYGFHQWDIKGNPRGILSAHPIAPFISVHHLEAVDPFYPDLNLLEGLQLFAKAMRMEPRSFLQRSMCYDHAHGLTFLVSLGYVIQVFPNVIYPRDLERSEQTYSAWNGINHRNEFDFDTRDPVKSLCKKPLLFYLKDVERDGNATLGTYLRAGGTSDLRKRVFCFPRSPPLHNIENIQVLGYPLDKNWHLAPRRMCCKIDHNDNSTLRLVVDQCRKGSLGSFF